MWNDPHALHRVESNTSRVNPLTHAPADMFFDDQHHVISVYYSIRCSFTENTRIPTCLCLLFNFLVSGKMSNRNKSSSKRASKASKQSGLLETLTRSEKRPTFVDEDEPTGTVIDLDDDDPVSEKVKIIYGENVV